DVARAAMLAAQQAEPGSIYNVTDGTVHEVREIVDAISAAAHRRLLPGYVPLAPARAIAGAIEDLFGLFGRTSPIGRHTLDKFVEDVGVSGHRLQADLGFQPIFDLTSGWRQALDAPPRTRKRPAWTLRKC